MKKRALVIVAALLAVGVIGGQGLPAVARAGQPVAFANQRLVSFTGVSVSHDFEPELKVGPNGTIYEVANYHNTSTGQRGVELWSAPFGTPLTSDGLIPPPLGGLDVDVAVGSTGNVYDGTLFYDGNSNWGIGAGACPTGSIPSNMSQCYGQQRVDVSHTDRPWVAADGPSTVYLSYRDGADSDQIDVTKSTDAGHTWSAPAEAISPSLRNSTNFNFNNLHGNVAVDPTTHDVFQIFVAGHQTAKGTDYTFNNVYMAVSTDGGQTFTDHLVYTGPSTATYDNFWPVVTTDAAGNVYAGWSDARDVWMSASSDHGTTWTAPVKISQDSASLQTSVEPWLAGGAAGDVAVVWYGSAATNNMDTSATWNVYFAQVRHATASSPSISQMVASNHIVLTGALCTEGDACPAGTRLLYDDFEVALNPRTGLAAIAYGDATDSGNPYQVDAAWQTSGPGL